MWLILCCFVFYLLNVFLVLKKSIMVWRESWPTRIGHKSIGCNPNQCYLIVNKGYLSKFWMFVYMPEWSACFKPFWCHFERTNHPNDISQENFMCKTQKFHFTLSFNFKCLKTEEQRILLFYSFDIISNSLMLTKLPDSILIFERQQKDLPWQ